VREHGHVVRHRERLAHGFAQVSRSPVAQRPELLEPGVPAQPRKLFDQPEVVEQDARALEIPEPAVAPGVAADDSGPLREHQRPAAADIGSIRRMSWQEFETLVGEAYRRQGYSVEETGGGDADGGVDLILRGKGTFSRSFQIAEVRLIGGFCHTFAMQKKKTANSLRIHGF
jgi:hypothetical protein